MDFEVKVKQHLKWR